MQCKVQTKVFTHQLHNYLAVIFIFMLVIPHSEALCIKSLLILIFVTIFMYSQYIKTVTVHCNLA